MRDERVQLILMKLSSMKILYAIPTYKRAGDITSLNLFDEPILFVDTSEMKEYEKTYPEVKIVEHKGDKGLTPKLNTILDYARKNKYDAVWKCDDDFLGMAYFAEGYTNRTSDKVHIKEVIENICRMAQDAGTPLFMSGQVADIRKYPKQSPFNMFATLKLGAYGLLLDNDLRFDERFILKQDIDMCMQVILNYRFVFIDERYSFYCKPTMGNKGGCASYRTREREKEVMNLLKKKWGVEAFTNTVSKRVSVYTLNIANPFK